MNTNKKTGRIIGVLLLLMFIIGIINYQYLRDPAFHLDSYLSTLPSISNQIIIAALVGILMGILSIVVAILFLPIFKKHNYRLAFLYLAFCILYFVMFSFENISLLTLLEFSISSVENEALSKDYFNALSDTFYHFHNWSHEISLLFSCFPVFVLYYTLYRSKITPRFLSVFGIFAALLMLFEMARTLLYGHMNMTLFYPIAIIQLLFPIWLLIKGLNEPPKINNKKQG